MRTKLGILPLAIIIALAGCDDETTGTTDPQTPPTDSSSGTVNENCDDMTNLYFCDDFDSQDLSTNWQVLAESGGDPDGVFDVPEGRSYLRYTAGSSGGELLLAQNSVLDNLPSDGNYFVEARIRPRQNSTTANKQLFLMGRWQSEGNWYAGGLNVQNSTSSTKVEVATSIEGSITRPVQSSKPIELGTAGGEDDGTWYTTRFEMIDDNLSVYLDGEPLGTTQDSLFVDPGNFGVFTNNRSFEIDYIKVGDPSIKPVQLTLDYASSAWTSAVAGEDPLVINVTALQSDGVTEDTFSVESSDENVVTVDVQGRVVTLSPIDQGSAVVTFYSGSNPSLVKTLDVSVDPRFIMPTADYGNISSAVTPTVNSTEQFIDTTLSISFDNEIAAGSSGQVRIYRSSDDTLVDTLKMSEETDSMGYRDQANKRTVYYRPLDFTGNTLSIKLHSDVLDYGETYYVVIGDGVVNGAELNGNAFVGLGQNSNWSFTTKAAMPSGNTFSVGHSSGADFATLQGVFNHIMQYNDSNDPITIDIEDGTYNELLFLRDHNNVTIRGASREGTVLQYDNFETFNSGTGKSEPVGGTPSGGRAVFLAENVDLLTLENLTLKNTHQRDNQYSNQAETIYFNSEGRFIAKDADFISEQDTLLLKGYNWFYNTLIAGNVDFIWGYNTATVFENSEIRTLGDSKAGVGVTTRGGYVLQARTNTLDSPGFVFIGCQFTNGEGPVGNTVETGSTYFARSGGNANYFDNVVLVNSQVDDHIADIGWAVEGINGQPAPNPSQPTATSGWREYNTMDMSGTPADTSQRQGVYILSEEEAEPYSTRENVFAGYNDGQGWTPTVN
ncbi:pectinesterase family protein [Vibrio sp. AK197]